MSGRVLVTYRRSRPRRSTSARASWAPGSISWPRQITPSRSKAASRIGPRDTPATGPPMPPAAVPSRAAPRRLCLPLRRSLDEPQPPHHPSDACELQIDGRLGADLVAAVAANAERIVHFGDLRFLSMVMALPGRPARTPTHRAPPHLGSGHAVETPQHPSDRLVETAEVAHPMPV